MKKYIIETTLLINWLYTLNNDENFLFLYNLEYYYIHTNFYPSLYFYLIL